MSAEGATLAGRVMFHAGSNRYYPTHEGQDTSCQSSLFPSNFCASIWLLHSPCAHHCESRIRSPCWGQFATFAMLGMPLISVALS